MVFHCRCFSFSYEEEIFHTAPSQFSKSDMSRLTDKPSNLRVFTVVELKAATNNFCNDRKIGEDGFGGVFKGMITTLEHPFDDKQVIVKYGTLQGLQEWVTEVNIFGVDAHPNFVKLVGYCVDCGERGIQLLLVYEYMPKESLQDHLSKVSETPLSWTMRLKVAQDVARALTYMNEEMDSQADGTLGYTAPAPKHIPLRTLTSSSNISSYGVFLYELITGRPYLAKNLPENEQQVVEWVKPFQGSKSFQINVDSRLEGKYSLKSAQRLLNIANRCLSKNQKLRPKMSDVLEMVNQLIGNESQETISDKSLMKSFVRGVAIKLKKAFKRTTKSVKDTI